MTKKKASAVKEGLQAHKKHKPTAPSELAAPQSDESNKQASLLGLPAELRNHIYRYALVENGEIRLWGFSKNKQPGIMRASKQLRAETTPIYYNENSFVVVLHSCKLEPHVGHWVWNGPMPVKESRGLPSWTNLKAWLRKYYEYRDAGISLGGPISTWYGCGSLFAEAFDIVDELADLGKPWASVELVLESFKKGVDAKNPQVPWA